MSTPTASASPVTLRRDGAVAVLSFNRPEALNALDIASAQAFAAACREIAADSAAGRVRAVVMRGEGKAFGVDLVQEARQLAGESGRMMRQPVAAAGVDGAGQQQDAPRFGYCRRQVQRIGEAEIGGEAEIQLRRIDVSQRHHARQQEGLAHGLAQEGFRERAGRAPRRQQDGDVGEQLPIRGARQQPRRQRVQERHARRDGGKAHGESAFSRSSQDGPPTSVTVRASSPSPKARCTSSRSAGSRSPRRSGHSISEIASRNASSMSSS